MLVGTVAREYVNKVNILGLLLHSLIPVSITFLHLWTTRPWIAVGSFGGQLLGGVAPAACPHFHRRLFSSHAQLSGRALLGRKGAPDPTMLQWASGWLCPFCDCCHHILVPAPQIIVYLIPFPYPPSRRTFSFHVGKLFKAFSEMTTCL